MIPYKCPQGPDLNIQVAEISHQLLWSFGDTPLYRADILLDCGKQYEDFPQPLFILGIPGFIIIGIGLDEVDLIEQVKEGFPVFVVE
jgi:hypothetical protein